MNQIDIRKEVERLLQFGLRSGMLEELDLYPARNALLDLLQIAEPYDGALQAESLNSPVPILENLLDYAAEIGLIPDNTTTQRDLMDAKIMGLLMPRQSEVARSFWNKAKEASITQATDDFYRLSQNSNYIRMDRIQKNEYWLAATEYGNLEITVNLSKPEKDPKEIAAERNAKQSHYPKCLLCIENVGYAGRINHPARQNHRVVPLELGGQQWYFQYSPYVYYNEHCIIFSEAHTPMQVNGGTFAKLLEFAAKFPHYFIGSNAGLPIVGGSILNHEHYQGGKHLFPMEAAPVEKAYSHPDFNSIKIGIVKWPMSVIRIAGSNPEHLIGLSSYILEEWTKYSDEEADIVAYTNQNGGPVQHNTITPIARKNAQGEFELDLVLRNNRTSDEHPEGIFHPHRELHHIKKENIGLIEVMGLAVLPGRLKQELHQIAACMTGERTDVSELAEKSNDPLHKHTAWIQQLIQKYGNRVTPQEAERVLRAEVGGKFLQVLGDAGIYKRNEQGAARFHAFMIRLGFQC